MNILQAIELVGKTYKDALKPISLNDINCYDELLYRKSGCLALDWIMANHSHKGGLPRGRFIEIFGPEGCGKTTAAIVMAASIQTYKKQNIALILDFEHKINLPYAIALGLDTTKTIFLQPRGTKAGEAGMQLMIECLDASDCGIIIVDSVAQISSKEELEGELTDANIGATARLQSRALKKANEKISPGSPTVVLINQLRDNIGGYGSTEKTTGARSIKFSCAIRIDIRARKKITDSNDIPIGQELDIKAVKNQCGRPWLKETTNLYYGEGYDNTEWMIEKAENLGVIKTAKKDKDNPSGVFISLTDGKDVIRIPKSQLTEYLSDSKIHKQLYSCLIEANNKLVEEESKGLNRVKSKEKEDSKIKPEKSKEEEDY